jgi:sugar/nucleoside kinase (ribokinase family)
MKKYDITVIGDINVDLILSGEDIVPDFGQKEKIVDNAILELGGSSGILACCAGRLGLRVNFIGKLGADDFGLFLLKGLEKRGVDTANIVIDQQEKTGVTLHLSRPHDRAMLTYLGTIALMESQDINKQVIYQTRHLHISSFFLQKGLQKGLLDVIIKAQEKGVTVSLDPGWDPEGRWNKSIKPILERIDIFLPNDQEAMHITSSKSVEEALEKLSNYKLIPVIKMGKNGACSLNSGKVSYCPSFNVKSIDTTGAGDSFNAGFLFGYLNEYSLLDCLRWGCACGGLSTTQVGGIIAQPTPSDVMKLFEEDNINSIL